MLSRLSQRSFPKLGRALCRPKSAQAEAASVSEDLQSSGSRITRLANGVRVVSDETFGTMSTVGVVVGVGSRCENTRNAGVCHLLDRVSYQSTKTRSSQEMSHLVQDIGSLFNSLATRDAMLYMASAFTKDIPAAMDVIADTVLNPTLCEEDISSVQQILRYEIQDLPEKHMDQFLVELVHKAAYGDRSLGRSIFCQEKQVEKLTPEIAQDFHATHYTGGNFVVTGASIDHDFLVDIAKEYFGSTSSKQAPEIEAPVYQGGKLLINKADQEFANLAVAYKSCSWNDADIYAMCTLHMLLGGGGSFSAGGPGKGMYSRLYQNVLNQYGFVQNCQAFISSYADSGLFGIQAICPHEYVSSMLKIIDHELHSVLEGVQSTELQRAKNQLKSSLLMNLEMKQIMFEDMGRQVIMSGKRQSAAELIVGIDSVTAGDIQQVVRDMLKHPMSLAAYGKLNEMRL